MEIKYTKEFKTEAIRLGEREGVTAAGDRLGIATRYVCYSSLIKEKDMVYFNTG